MISHFGQVMLDLRMGPYKIPELRDQELREINFVFIPGLALQDGRKARKRWRIL